MVVSLVPRVLDWVAWDDGMWGGGGGAELWPGAPGCGLCLKDVPAGAVVGSGGGGGGGNSGCDGGVSCDGVCGGGVYGCVVSLVSAKSMGEWTIGAGGVV